MMPLYLKKCAAVISISRLTTENFYNVFSLPPGKIKTIYFGPGRHFQRITDPVKLQEVNSRYNLPDKFIFTLTKNGGENRKNLSQILQAYILYHQRAEMPHKMVIGGVDGRRFLGEDQLPENGYESDIIYPGWIEQEDLPAVYSQADLYLYPSNLEAFPIPITEAMACGTPVITSDANGLKEIAGDAALLIDPLDYQAISDAIYQVLSDPNLRMSLSLKGLIRSNQFTWDACARETLKILESIAS
jgi:glycosyltransferase involved in cell wall biosynthesis